MRTLIAIALLLCTPLAFAGRARITDSETGAPIAGATVYIYWYYHPISIPTFVETHGDDTLCRGTAIATTDADGYYQTPSVGVHEVHQYVVAEGYYNDWEGPEPDDAHDFARILSTLKWDQTRKQQDRWAKRLTPFGNASIDAKLLFLSQSARHHDGNCSLHPEDITLAQFSRAARRLYRKTLCDAGANGQTPRRDLFPNDWLDVADRARLPRHRREAVPHELVAAACSKSLESP